MNEITITMEHPNKPPKVVLNGQAIDGIVELTYQYNTSTDETFGVHGFTLKYVDKESQMIRTVSANRELDDDLPTRLEGSD